MQGRIQGGAPGARAPPWPPKMRPQHQNSTKLRPQNGSFRPVTIWGPPPDQILDPPLIWILIPTCSWSHKQCLISWLCVCNWLTGLLDVIWFCIAHFWRTSGMFRVTNVRQSFTSRVSWRTWTGWPVATVDILENLLACLILPKSQKTRYDIGKQFFSHIFSHHLRRRTG